MSDRLEEIKARFPSSLSQKDEGWLITEVERLRRGGKCSECDGTGDEMVDSMTLYGVPGGYDVGGPCPACAGTGSKLAASTIAGWRAALQSLATEAEFLVECYDTGGNGEGWSFADRVQALNEARLKAGVVLGGAGDDT
jgi:hypothetical protein